MTARIALVGARGHTGRELIRLISERDDMVLAWAGSRSLSGRHVTEMAPEADPDLVFKMPDPETLAGLDIDAVVLALPNGAGEPYVAAIDSLAPQRVIVDLSADYRFDDNWVYGLPEAYGRERIAGARRIANPGCYATAGQLAVAPLRDHLAAPAHVFGVSGYSGAGTTPSRKNDTEALKDNLMPYALTGHIHEREMSRHLGLEVRFTPHVAEFFRGITATVHLDLKDAMTPDTLQAHFAAFYQDEALVRIQDMAPEIRDGAYNPGAVLGGFAVGADGHHAVIVCAEDNLLKGAAVQAVQNLCLSLGLPE
ncbi:N-acetyl-gamma-glutamyl-phosphate reductase [Maricaulis sp. D1M11]|uniref:N-acetyl-gamma-glutamyl-phosphate reductase n=1 Tax=Maricaulis sp. D1M11 TaxID=3076117 RepID=UPI0039B4F139